MKKTLVIGALTAAMAISAPLAASAQAWGHDRDRDGRYERWERREDRRDNRYERRQDRREYRHDRREARRYYRGATLPRQYRSNWYINDYQRYGYRAPPRGYGYYRTDTGDIVLAALATGVIISLLSN
ncbi:MAG: hypothetical protein EON87_21280 [Brevundimonas sp.]|nr:MAG: hypothetical protein EON87_21280 [Brevundimonas sp.]